MSFIPKDSVLDILIIVLYLCCSLILGVYKSKKNKTVADYAIGSQKFSVPILVATIAATAIGGAATMGLAEKSYSLGIVFIIIFLGDVVSKLIIAKYIACRFDQFQGMISAGEIMGSFYGNTGRIITGISGTLISVGYVAAQFSATGLIFEMFFGIPFVYGALIGVGVTILYAALGGIRGVAITDVLQFAVLIIAIPMVLNISIGQFPSWEALWDKIPSSHFELFPPGKPSYYYISLFIIFCLPLLSPAMIQRLLMAKNSKEAQLSMRATAYIELPFFIVAGAIGFIAFAMNDSIPPSQALPYIINEALPSGFKGFAVAGMLAVVMSSADSYLNAAAITFVHDVLRPLSKNRMPDHTELKLNISLTFILGFATLFITLYMKNIVDIMVLFFNFWGPVVIIPLISGILGIRVRTRAFVYSMLAGFAVFFLWTIFEINSWLLLDYPLPSFLANGLVFFSFVFKERKKKISRPKILWPFLKNTWDWFYHQTRDFTHEPPYVMFGIFCALNFNIPYFMWNIHDQNELHLTLRFTAGVLCFFLIIKDYWHDSLTKYLKPYWYFTLWYCLPFFTTYMMIQSHGALEWVINVGLMLFFLTVLTRWFSFTLLLLSGVTIAFLVTYYVDGPPVIHLSEHLIYLASYMYVFAILIGLLFARRREMKVQEKYTELQLLGGAIAHEMRTPLSAIGSISRGLEKYLPSLLEAYTQYDQSKHNIPKQHLKKMQDIPDALAMTVQQAQNTIDMLLMKVKNLPTSYNWPLQSIKKCITLSLKEYPFTEKEKNILIYDDRFKDFNFRGDMELMKHVFFNLIKNALYHTNASGKTDGTVKLFVTNDRYTYKIHVWDNGQGIEKARMKNMFERFNTQREGGTGIGLAFCQDVIFSFGGTIICNSEEGKFTEFVITFPKRIDDI